jgi:hypothetical protein
MVEMAGVYGDSLTLTCILNEGQINVTSGSLVETGKMGTNTYGFNVAASEIKEGDFVALSLQSYHTYANCGGLPVVEAGNATSGWIGIVKSTPVWHKVPTATRPWAEAALTAGTYRVASVVFPSLNMALKAESKGNSTAIENGAPLKWDLTEDAFIDAGTTFTGAMSFHHNAADNTEVLVGFGQYSGASGNTDCGAFDMIAS